MPSSAASSSRASWRRIKLRWADRPVRTGTRCRTHKFNRSPHYWRHKAPLHQAPALSERRRESMTPQERQMIDDLFDRLARLEGAPRDPDAASAIAQGLQKAPNAVYALVQTVLVQDEALKRANSRIQELEAGGAPSQQQSGGFPDSMRDAVFGQDHGQNQPHGSVPSGPPPPSRPVWNSGQGMQQAQSPRRSDQAPYGQPSHGP